MFEKFFDDSDSMTKEEAVVWLKAIRDSYSDGVDELGEELDSKVNSHLEPGVKMPSEIIRGFTNKMKIALDVAIENLENVTEESNGEV